MELGKSSTRLSTGLRINSGADDPAGLIAVEGYRTQIGGMTAALGNNQDALNFAKTADGALDETTRLLRDARSLTVANGNSSLSADQKQANQTQLNNIMTSIDRIASNTSFGSRKLLDGSAGTRVSVANKSKLESAFVSGTLGGVQMSKSGTLDVNVTTGAAQAAVSGTTAYTAGTVALTASGTFSINGYSFSASSGDTINSVIAKINGATGSTGVSAVISGGVVAFSSTGYGLSQKINLTEGGGGLLLAAGATATAAGVDAIAAVTYKDTAGATVSTATFNKGDGLSLKDSNGNQIKLTVTGNGTSITGGIQVIAGSSNFQIGANGGDTANLNLSNFSSAALSVSTLDITGNDMQTSIDAIDAAIKTVSSSRGSIGSFMKNTIESNMRALGVAKENLTATSSSLSDTDIAEEMTNYTKLNILQQSGLAMLAQANSAPQGVLSLLR